MRFISITYRNFGPFQQKTLDVSQGTQGLHLVYGPNEAGKTNALEGLGFLLFGFPHHPVTHDFRYPRGEQRVGAKLRDSRGRELECCRRRGLKNTLRGSDDRAAISEEQLSEFLGGLTREQFDMLFGLTHDQLVAGGRAMVEG
jgi:uncharacterized protein YhaN